MDDKVLQMVGELLGVLEKLVEERGVPKANALVDKNVVNSSIGSKGSSPTGLTSGNKKLLTETFTLFNKLFFEYQKKTAPDIKDKTLVTKIAKTQKKAEDRKPPEIKKSEGLMGMIMGGLALLAASVGGLVMALTGAFGDFSGVVEVIGKVGFVGALKILSKTIMKRFAISALKRLPFIGGIISFAFAVKAFKDGEIFKGVGYIISGLLNFIPGVGPFLSLGADILIAWAEGKGMFNEGGALSKENGWKTIKGWCSNMGKFIWDNALNLPLVATFKRFGMASEAFSAGKYVEGLKQIGFGFISIGVPWLVTGMEALMGFLSSDGTPTGDVKPDKSWGSKLNGWIKSKLKDLPWYIKQPLAWFGVIPEDQVGAPPGIYDSLIGGKLTAAKDMAKNFKDGMLSRGKQFGEDFLSSTKDYVKGMKDATAKTWENSKTAWADLFKSTTAVTTASAKTIGADMKSSTEKYVKWSKENSAKVLDNAKTTVGGLMEDSVPKIKDASKTAKSGMVSVFDSIDKWIKTPKPESSVDIPKKNELATILSTTGEDQNTWSQQLYKASIDQVKLLGMLVNIGNSTVQELKRMSGNGSGGKTTTIVSPPPALKQSLTPVSTNRLGYMSSPYAIT